MKEENTCFGVIDEIQEYFKGKYLCMLSADDGFKKEKIEKQVEFLENNPEYKVCLTYIECLHNYDDSVIQLFNKKREKDRFESQF